MVNISDHLEIALSAGGWSKTVTIRRPRRESNTGQTGKIRVVVTNTANLRYEWNNRILDNPGMTYRNYVHTLKKYEFKVGCCERRGMKMGDGLLPCGEATYKVGNLGRAAKHGIAPWLGVGGRGQSTASIGGACE